MKSVKKGNRVKKICDGITTNHKLKGFVMFEDNWITENNKILYNKDGELFSVLDFQCVEENTLIMPEIMPYLNGWAFRKFSCVKLDKEVNVGDVLYIQ
ncbi:MAG: hypothetical protein ACOC33_04250 [bacterium]